MPNVPSVTRVQLTSPGSPTSRYEIVIGRDILSQLPDFIEIGKYSSLFAISDSTVWPLWGSALEPLARYKRMDRVLIPAGEQHKTINTLQHVWQAMQAAKLDRSALVLNLGGGVVGDLGGFAAATYMRGIDFVQLPSTLLAQVDASVGGKLAIDFSDVKNLVGVFAQPQAVLADVACLSTLSPREFRSGLAELIKHGIIADAALFERITSESTQPESAALPQLIGDSCAIKARIVESDERETGPRKTLNFGHTAGHALESLLLKTPDALLHGEAIVLGMLVAARISQRLHMLENSELALIENKFKELGFIAHSPRRLSYSAVHELLLLDKKNRAGAIRWTLLRGIGTAVYDQTVDPRIAEECISSIFPKDL
jgi:3-dehydroquinate synthase